MSKNLKTVIYALIFGVMSGIVVTFALSIFIPQFFTDWAASLVCQGRVEYLSFKQAYYCFTAPNTSFDINNLMFWAVFKRIVLITLPLCILLSYGFTKLAEFMYQRREAAGF